MAPNEDPNNLNGNPVPTHINAYYADLAQAQKDAAEANGRVEAAKAAIVTNGGTLPSDTADVDDIAVAGDEAQLAQDETADTTADATEAPESDAPAAVEATPENSAEEPAAESTGDSASDGDADDSKPVAPVA